MKYQEEEEKKLLNQSKSRFPENINQYNSNIMQNNNLKAEWIYVDPSIYINYILFNGISISLGCFLKLIYPITREKVGKTSLITGIPIIRNYYFFFPFMLNLIYFIWCIRKFYSSNSIKNNYENENSVLKYLKNIRGGFFFTNILLLLTFYALYYLVVLSIYKSFGFKLSGHIIASILSGGMIVNLHNTYEPFINNYYGLNPTFNKYISYANLFLYYHSIYTVFWSSWIFHQVIELILAYFISIIALFIVHVINIDELCLILIDFNYLRKNPVILYNS
jgi:hypothetical protein